MEMSENMFAGSNKAGSSNYNISYSGINELVTFSVSEKEKLKVMLNCLQPDMTSWLQEFVNAKVKEILLSQQKPLTSIDRNIEDEIYNYESRRLELRFSNNIRSSVLTKENITGEGHESLRLSLFDSSTGEAVKLGPQSSERVQIVVLEGDSYSDERESWMPEEFDKRVVGEGEGEKSLLGGNVFLNLINGTGCVPDIYFKSKSRWMKKTRFRLGARLADKSSRIRVKGAMTKHFDVMDKREKLYKSHDIPSLSDEVWRLQKLGKRGQVNKRLGMENIKTVKDFLDLHFTNPKRLHEIFGQASKNLEDVVSHARKCPDKLMYYHHPSHHPEQKTGVVFNVSGEVLGLVLEGIYASSNMLSETEKELAEKSVTYAFKHWGDVIPFEDHKYISRNCSSHHLSEADINELISDDILVFIDPFTTSAYHGLEPPTFESIVQNIDGIFRSIDAQKPNVNPHLNPQHADIAFSVNAFDAAKAYKSWKLLLLSIRFLSRKKHLKCSHVHKKPKLY